MIRYSRDRSSYSTYNLEILYLARLSFIIEGEVKSFPDKQNLKEFITTKLALQEILKGRL